VYLVTGATGNVGSRLAATLRRDGHAVQGLITREERRDALPDGVRPVVGDLDGATTLVDALAGVTGIFLLPGFSGAAGLLAAAAAAKVRRLVQLSCASAVSPVPGDAIAASRRRAENLATTSELAWTILRPTSFMTNALRWRSQLRAGDELRLPFANVATAIIDPADVAAVAAAVLTSETNRHEHRILPLTGPEPLSVIEQVAILADVLERPLYVVPRDHEQAGLERPACDESVVLPTLERILGRSPRSFAEWARRHRALFG
jgi:uncharacterized protein YbjT (DUF2867 family)